jgi:hypothetical protein
MRVFLFALFICFSTNFVHAQADLFGSEKTPARKGVVFGVNAGFDLPMGDMADRFGVSYRIGPSIMYKTTSNWLFGAKCDWIFGNQMKDDSLLANIKDRDGVFITNQGDRQGVGTFERGYAIGLQVGKIIPVFKNETNSGILIMTGVGFMQHKINIYDRDQVIAQVNGQYKKGYDRLTNGLYVEQYVGYNHFSKNGRINFHIGFDFLAGFTKGRRDYQFDLMRKDDKSRIDILVGLRGGWYIPLFRRKSEEIFFD